jgi:cytoplasmic tRNA 2-thiolation protein 1
MIVVYPCTAYRGHARVFLKDLEAIRPSAIIDIIHSGEAFQVDDVVVQNMKELSEYEGRCRQHTRVAIAMRC